MSFFSGGRSKDKDPLAKKSQFYVEFLGWMECRGLRGERYTEPVIRELRRRNKKMENPPKLTVQVSRKDLKITQEVEDTKKRGIKKIKFPIIPARDVTFVHQSARPGNGRLDDIVACIYLGYMPRTQRFVHVHVYRFDEAETASLFVNQMSLIIGDNQEHIRQVEIDLANKGEVDDPRLIPSEELYEHRSTDSAVSSASRSYSDEESATHGSEDIDPDLQSLIDIQPFDSVTNELKYRLQVRDAPLLLPPKDYDTISRAHGNLTEINKRRCLNVNITGVNDLSPDNNASFDNKEDIPSPAIAEAESDKKNPANKTIMTTLKPSENQNSPRVSPKLKHVPLPLKDNNKTSPQVPRRPTDFNEHNQSPRVLRRSDDPESVNPIPGFNSGYSEMLQSPTDYVYPPKTNSPMSPRMVLPSQGPPLSRQSSQNSYKSDGSKLGNRSDENRAAAPIQYKSAPNSDLYALPLKAFKQAVPPTLELPPDYQDDDELLSGMSQPYGQQYLTQSLPADIMREKLTIGNNSRPNSAELHLRRRIDSPVFLTGPPQQRINGGMHSPHIHRHAPR